MLWKCVGGGEEGSEQRDAGRDCAQKRLADWFAQSGVAHCLACGFCVKIGAKSRASCFT